MLTALGLLCVTQSLFAFQGPTLVTSVEGVNEYRFPNGARVLLFPDESRPTISVNMTVLVGSRHEGYGEAGMAHLLEHMVFKGTPTFPNVPKALRDHGASFNGTTNVDRTNYFETLPASDDNLEFAIQLECDRLINSYVNREDLMSEFSVVRNEFERGENSPQSVLSQRVQAVAYEWHNYGKSTIGNRSDIERVPIDNLKAFYQKFYQPDNIVLIVTGKFDEKTALKHISKYLGSMPKPTRKLDPTYTEEPAQDGERLVVLRRVGSVGAVNVAYHMPSASHADWAPLTILASVLSEDKVGLLDSVLVETRKATSARAFADTSHDPGLFSFSAEPGEASVEEVKELLLTTIEQMKSGELSGDAVERAKVRLMRRNELTLSNAASMSQALSSAAALGDWRLFFLMRDNVAAVKLADVQRVADTYFKSYNRTVGLFIPEKEPQRLTVPTVPSIEDLVKDYKGGKKVEAGEAFDPSPANLDARTIRADADGVKISMIPKKNRGETVALTMTLHYGNAKSLEGASTSAGVLPMLMMTGTTTMNRQALQAKMDELGVQIGIGIGGGRRGGRGGGGRLGSTTFSITGKRNSLVPAVELLGKILREPALAEDEFSQMRARTLSGLKEGLNEPASLAGNKLARALSQYPKGDVRYVQTSEERISEFETIKIEQIRDIYKSQLSAAKVEVGIVGDFDPAEVVPAVFNVLKDWNTGVKFEPIESEAKPDQQGAREEIITPDKENAEYLAGHSFKLNDQDPDAVRLQIANFIFGGGTLSSRLGDRIRQKDGLSYGASSSISIPSRGNDARFVMTVSTNPVNMDAVDKAAMEELESFVKDGPTQKELDDAKKAFLETTKIGRTQDGSIAGQLASNAYLERTFAFSADEEARIAALTTQDVKDAFKRHVNPAKLVIIRAGDFKK
jgi:zinc protease